MTTEANAPTWRESLAERLVVEAIDARESLVLLTPAEMEAARLLAKGYQNSEIAQLLGIKTGTVEAALVLAFKKLGIRSRLELAVMVAKAGLS